MKKESFLKGAFIATLCIIISKILGILYVIPFHAIIGERGGTLYGYAYSLYALFLTLSTVGIPLAISKIVSEYDTLGYHHAKEKAYRLALYITTAMSILSSITLFIFAPFLAHAIIGDITGGHTYEEITFVVRVAATGIFFVTILSVMRGYLQGHKYITASSVSQIIEQFVRIIVIIVGSYLALNVFHMSLAHAVGVSIFGATAGGIVALIYLYFKMKKARKSIVSNASQTEEEKKITTKQILKKLVLYTVPFILMSLVTSSYELIDTFTVVKTLVNEANFKVETAESVMSVLTTWGSKLNVIVVSIASGIVISLLPNITSDYVSKNYKEVRRKLNKTLQLILFLTIPMATGLSFLAQPVWNIFYGASEIGPKVFCYSIFMTIFASLFMNINVAMQSLDKLKQVYLSLIVGVVFTACMNAPMMIIFYHLGLPAYYGATTCKIIGYTITIGMNLITLKKHFQIRYQTTIKHSFYCLCANLMMVLVLTGLKTIVPITDLSKIESILVVMLYAIVGGIIYLTITYKTKTIETIFGKEFINKILHFKKGTIMSNK